MAPDLLAVKDPLTLRLALVLGAFLLAASSALVHPPRAQKLLESISASPGVMHATAALTAFVGLGLLALHPDVSSPAASLVSATAAWWALEGLGLLAFGHRLPIDTPLSVRAYALSNIPAGVVGAFLLIAGLFGHASLPAA